MGDPDQSKKFIGPDMLVLTDLKPMLIFTALDYTIGLKKQAVADHFPNLANKTSGTKLAKSVLTQRCMSMRYKQLQAFLLFRKR